MDGAAEALLDKNDDVAKMHLIRSVDKADFAAARKYCVDNEVPHRVHTRLKKFAEVVQDAEKGRIVEITDANPVGPRAGLQNCKVRFETTDKGEPIVNHERVFKEEEIADLIVGSSGKKFNFLTCSTTAVDYNYHLRTQKDLNAGRKGDAFPYCPCGGSKGRDIGTFGTGVALYFDSIKLFGFLALLCACAYIPVIMNNYSRQLFTCCQTCCDVVSKEYYYSSIRNWDNDNGTYVEFAQGIYKKETNIVGTQFRDKCREDHESVFIKSKNREECRNYKCVDAYPDIKEHIKYYSTPNPRSNEFDWDTKTCMYILNTTNTSLTDLYQNRILAGSSYNSQEFIDTQAWADLIVIAILSLAAVYWYYWLNRKAEKIDRLHATAQDFAVEITDPPVDMKDPDVYYNYFSKRFGTVVNVVVHMNNGKIIHELGNRKKCHRAREYELAKETMAKVQNPAGLPSPESPGKPPSCCDKLQKKGYAYWNDQLLKSTEKIKKLMDTNVGTDVARVFVTFNTEHSQKNCLRSHACPDKNVDGVTTGGMGRSFFSRLFGKDEAGYGQELDTCKVVQAMEPSDVHWENLQIEQCCKRGCNCCNPDSCGFCGVLKAWIITVFLIIAIFVLLMFAKTSGEVLLYAKDFNANNKCYDKKSEYAKNVTDAIASAKASNRLINGFSANSTVGAAVDYLSELSEDYGESVKNGVIAGSITCLNLFLPNMIKAISLNEIHPTHSDMQASMMTKLTVVRFMNTAILTFVVTKNCKMLSLTTNKAIMLILILDLIVNQAVRFLDFYNLCCRCYSARQMKTKQMLNAKWRGTYWNLGERYTDILKTFFVALFYATMLPTGFIVTCLCMFTIYWLDKWLLLRRWRVPPAMDEKLARLAHRFFVLGIYTHVWTSFFFFANWPFDYSDVPGSTAAYGRLKRDDVKTTGSGDFPEAWERWQYYFKPTAFVQKLAEPNAFKTEEGNKETYMKIYFGLMIVGTILVLMEVLGFTIYELFYQIFTNGPGVTPTFDPETRKAGKSSIAYTFEYDEVLKRSVARPFEYLKSADQMSMYVPRTKVHYDLNPENVEYHLNLIGLWNKKENGFAGPSPYSYGQQGEKLFIVYRLQPDPLLPAGTVVPTPPALIDPETSRGSIIKVYALSAGQHKEFKVDAERQGILWEGLGGGGFGGGFGGGAVAGGGVFGGAVPQQYPQQPGQYPPQPGAVAVQYPQQPQVQYPGQPIQPGMPQYPAQVQPVGQYEAKNQEYMQQPFGGMGQQQQMQMPQQPQQMQYQNPNYPNNFVAPVPQNIEMAPIQVQPAAPAMVVAPAMPGALQMAWTCLHCTVVNDPSATICCVCSKSKPTAVAGGGGGQAGGQGVMAGALGF